MSHLLSLRPFITQFCTSGIPFNFRSLCRIQASVSKQLSQHFSGRSCYIRNCQICARWKPTYDYMLASKPLQNREKEGKKPQQTNKKTSVDTSTSSHPNYLTSCQAQIYSDTRKIKVVLNIFDSVASLLNSPMIENVRNTPETYKIVLAQLIVSCLSILIPSLPVHLSWLKQIQDIP